MTGQVVPGKTTILREYSRKIYLPGVGETPYYVINEPENIELYKKYRARVEGVLNFHVVGRLAEYRYYDMDGVTASALRAVRRSHLEPLGTNDRCRPSLVRRPAFGM